MGSSNAVPKQTEMETGVIDTPENSQLGEANGTQSKKPRGRPKGSKNKPKATTNDINTNDIMASEVIENNEDNLNKSQLRRTTREITKSRKTREMEEYELSLAQANNLINSSRGLKNEWKHFQQVNPPGYVSLSI